MSKEINTNSDKLKIAKINYQGSGYEFKYGLLIAEDHSVKYPFLFKLFYSLEELNQKAPNLNKEYINGQSADEEWLEEGEFEFI